MATTAALLGIKIENIAYATDFHETSRAALPYALSLARKYGSKVYLVHVVNLSPVPGPGPTNALRAIEAQAIREAHEAALETNAGFGTVPHEAIIRKGNIWKEIADVVEQKAIDLIVTGTHGRSGVSKALMGSVAEKIFRHALCPVLTIGPKVHGDPDVFGDLHSILVPTDFSPESLAALSWTLSLAQANRSRVYLLHVTPAEDGVKSSLKLALHGLIPAAAELGCAPKAIVEHGLPSEKILDLAEELAADLIVLGVKPPALLEGTLPHQTMATASKVIGNARCPVVTVRPHA
jgi:nucleotide-binding universal stress UspA family protein